MHPVSSTAWTRDTKIAHASSEVFGLCPARPERYSYSELRGMDIKVGPPLTEYCTCVHVCVIVDVALKQLEPGLLTKDKAAKTPKKKYI